MTRLTIEQATVRQREAADPSKPRIVNANAGSGKTKVLVDRVSRILLQGTDPDKILCLTYTRAAASEMQERLFETLSKWSIASDGMLKDVLAELYGMPFDQIRPVLSINTVRTLFARALETPEGLKVMTIHAFCERIIGRFPIEAGIMPGFGPLDEPETKALLSDGRRALLAKARVDETVRAALHYMAAAKADSTIDGMIFSAARDFEKTQKWLKAGGVGPFRQEVGLAASDTEESYSTRAWQLRNQDHLRAYANLCEEIGGWSTKFSYSIEKAIAALNPAEAYQHYLSGFITGKGEITTQTASAKMNKVDPFLDKNGQEVERVRREFEQIKAFRIADMSDALLTLGHTLGQFYQRGKHAARGLDFNDLILKTRDLLMRRDVSDWVAYKLDGGVEHVLLDEAQDTSPVQWEIIDALTLPFEQESPDRATPPRTFFAVGDPKQSIYRFNGAAPEIFMDSVRTRTAPGDSPVQLRMSFRSAQQVLDVVDELFLEQGGMAATFDATTQPEPSDLVRHDAARKDEGLVELWPLSPKSEAADDNAPWDTTPVDNQSDGDPRVRLAREIASTVAHWIDSGEPIFDRKLQALRPMHGGDVLILVQNRVGGLFDALIKALKEERLPVAGADRLVLQDALIVRDLLAITRFVLLSKDCLSLAEALKSPLFGLDDNQLFALSVDRDGTLWDAVQTRAPDLSAHIQALRDDAALAPYDFFARLLDRRGPHGKTYREALFSRLGLEAREALDAFLAIALAHQQRQAPSLQRFVQAFTTDTVEIKRDKDPAGREVRVMTVHGAKGLEAPVVFLPDTTRAPRASSGGLIKAGDSYLLAPSSKESIPLVDAYKAANDIEDQREYMRLLYVAMTRAESRLVVCGYHHGAKDDGYAEGSWYHWVNKTMLSMEKAESFATSFDHDDKIGLRYGARPEKVSGSVADIAAQPEPLPAWINQPAVTESAKNQTASPSSLLARNEPIMRTPGRGRLQRGILIHRLLEILPDHAASRRRDLCDLMLEDYQDFSAEERDAIRNEVFGVLDNPSFSTVFAEGSRAEVSLAGRVPSIRGGDVYLTAQVDRLNVTPDTIYLVDYKSNRPVPTRIEDVDDSYLAQMAAYRELARAIWPGRDVRCGLLWTDTPDLMWLHDNAMDAVLTQVNAVPTSNLHTA